MYIRGRIENKNKNKKAFLQIEKARNQIFSFGIIIDYSANQGITIVTRVQFTEKRYYIISL